MTIRRLENVPTLPLEKDLISNAGGFTFEVNGMVIWHELPSRKEFVNLKKNLIF